ncbi:MAG: septation protein SepH [Mycobacterium sp.]|nr:septation protein SepH [Mycobacterium sp.]
MRELTLIGLDVGGNHIICEGGNPADKFLVRLDDRLRAAVRGDATRSGQVSRDSEVRAVLTPKDIQARIRAGASVQELAASSGMDPSKIDRFAHPVLLERQRAAELATAAHPVLAEGPTVETLLETVTAALTERGLSANDTTWDAWRAEDGRWKIRMGWQAGLSENYAHFRFTPGAHGGTVTAIDEEASALIDPEFERPLRPVAPVSQLEFDVPAAPVEEAAPVAVPPALAGPAARAAAAESAQPKPGPVPAKRSGRKPTIPAWEDVLLGVRSSGDR